MKLIRELALETGLSLKDVRRLVSTAPRRYKIFKIPKRTGGDRIIAQPASEIKALQKIVMRRILAQLPVHECAYAYVRGKSIRKNALQHSNSSHILKLDFENFFNSIRPIDLERVLLKRSVEGFSPIDFEDIYKISFWGLGSFHPQCLSVGAPSSPMISNIVMADFDKAVMELAAERNLTYTRYADDLTISSQNGPDSLLKFEDSINRLIINTPINIKLNDKKRGLYGRGSRRMVTGLIITPNGDISIGRDRKRAIRAGLNNLSKSPSDDVLLMWCKGMLSFVMSAEPSYMKTFYNRYGADFIRGVVRAPNVSFYDSDLQ